MNRSDPISVSISIIFPKIYCFARFFWVEKLILLLLKDPSAINIEFTLSLSPHIKMHFRSYFTCHCILCVCGHSGGTCGLIWRPACRSRKAAKSSKDNAIAFVFHESQFMAREFNISLIYIDTFTACGPISLKAISVSRWLGLATSPFHANISINCTGSRLL